MERTLGIQPLKFLLLRATNNSFPPTSVAEKWPRDLSKSVALHGPAARPVKQRLLQFEALAKSGLVSRTIAVPNSESPNIDVVDEPKTLAVEDSTPPNPPETVQDGKLPTWNARIHIKK